MLRNSRNPVWQSISVAVAGGSATNGSRFLAAATESFQQDDDGNLTQDGRWQYTWDAENRLTKVESLSNGPAASKRKVEYSYDAQGKMIRRLASIWSVGSGSYQTSADNRFICDGWQQLADLNSGGTLITDYVWGMDLSGSLAGAGGVGGLLAVKSVANGNHFSTFDGNGNVVSLIAATTGDETGRYEYGPFGEVIRSSGTMAKSNPFRFSTKYQDDETDLLYYGYRFYNPSTGRWPNRDPIGELGGYNLYGFVGNDPIRRVDLFGLHYVPGIPNWPPPIPPSMPVWPLPTYPGPRPGPNDQEIFWQLVQRWNEGTGAAFTIPESAMSRMLGRGINGLQLKQFKDLLKRRCAIKGADPFLEESDNTAGSYKEAWYLGGHGRSLSVKADCCARKFTITLSVSDQWDFDETESMTWPPFTLDNWKRVGSWGFASLLNNFFNVPVCFPINGMQP